MGGTIKNFIKFVSLSFQQMPFFLKFMALLGCFGIFFIVVPFMPFAYFKIEGKSVGIKEFWSSGVAIGFIITGIFLIISGVKTIKKDKKGRLLFILGLSSAYLNPYALLNGYLQDLIYLIGLFAPLGIICWYLYMKKSVQKYFLVTD